MVPPWFNQAVCGLQGFPDNDNQFIVKEFGVASEWFMTVKTFYPPYPKHQLNAKMRKTANWLERYYHKLSWDDGYSAYSDHVIRRDLREFDVVYTKGLEKVQFLSKFHPNVKDIDFEPVDNNRVDYCSLHCRTGGRCAYRDALRYFEGLKRKYLDESQLKDSVNSQPACKHGCLERHL